MNIIEYKDGMDILSLLTTAGIAPSRAEGRRLVQQGGIKVAEEKIESIEHKVKLTDFTNNELLIQKGKKVFHNIKAI